MSKINKGKAAASPDDLAKAGPEAPVELSETELTEVAGAGAAKTPQPKTTIGPKVVLSVDDIQMHGKSSQ